MVTWVETLRKDGMEYRDIAVFYRVNWISRILEDALRRRGIPYQILRGVEFFGRAEIKDMLAYLRLVVNPSDQVALGRAINRPTRGIGQTTVSRLVAYAQASGRDVWELVCHAQDVPGLGAAAVKRLTGFASLITTLAAGAKGPVAQIVKTVYEQSGLAKALHTEGNDEAADNVDELIHSASEYDAETAGEGSLAEYLQQIALVSDQDTYDEEAGAVSLMTLHAAKGLEFPAVFLTGVEDGLLPHSRSLYDEEGIEEERRLLFVGITRAKRQLCLSYARQRTVQGSTKATIRSEFLRPLQGLEFQPCELDFGAGRTAGFHDDDEGYRSVAQTTRSRAIAAGKKAVNRSAPRATTQRETITESAGGGFSRGQLVRHPKFGLGRILGFQAGPDSGFVEVKFNAAGRKTLALKYAKLEAADS